MKKIENIALFFNSERGLTFYTNFNDKFNLKLYLAKKFLDKKVINYLIENKINYIILENVKSKKLKISLKNIDLGIACGFPYIFKNDVMKIPKYGFLNCHAGKLPQYRGGSPLNWQLINGEKKFYLTVIKMSKEIDGGQIICEKKFLIKNNFNIKNLKKIADSNFPELINNAIVKLSKSKKLKRQSKKNVRMWPQRKPVDSYLDFSSKNNTNTINFIRACMEPYSAYFYFKKNKYKIINAKKSNKIYQISKITKIKDRAYVGCKNGSIILKNYKIISNNLKSKS